MIEGIPFPIVDWSPWALLGLGFVMLMTGRLKPWTTVRDMQAQYEDRISDLIVERDAWKTSSKNNEGTMAVQAESIRVNTESAKLQAHVMQALRENANLT